MREGPALLQDVFQVRHRLTIRHRFHVLLRDLQPPPAAHPIPAAPAIRANPDLRETDGELPAIVSLSKTPIIPYPGYHGTV